MEDGMLVPEGGRIDRLRVQAADGGSPYWFLGTLVVVRASAAETGGGYTLLEQVAPPGPEHGFTVVGPPLAPVTKPQPTGCGGPGCRERRLPGRLREPVAVQPGVPARLGAPPARHASATSRAS